MAVAHAPPDRVRGNPLQGPDRLLEVELAVHGRAVDEVEQGTPLRPLDLPAPLDAFYEIFADFWVLFIFQERIVREEGQFVVGVIDYIEVAELLFDCVLGELFLDGYFQDEMGFAALPGGECPTSPVEGTTNGSIVIDYSMDSIGRLSQPLLFNVKSGRVISVTGSLQEANAIERLLEKEENACNIAEFSIGTNPRARLKGNLAEDKKRLGTVHFAIGDNRSLGGIVEANIHLDGLMLEPTVIADNHKVLVRNGHLMV